MAHFLFNAILSVLLHSTSFPKFSVVGVDTLFPNQTLVTGQKLISESQIFELGFFSPGKSRHKYLGIWYKSTPDVVVWVANRNNPITESEEAVFLAIAGNRTLIICSGETISWSAAANSPPGASNPILQLLNTGNMVLLDTPTGDPIWQSFDHPTDTWLPGMKMVDDDNPDMRKYLTSWRSSGDPSTGDFVFRIDNHGLPEMTIFRGSEKKFRTGKWNGLYMSGVPPFPNRIFNPELVFEGERLVSISEPHNSSVVSRLLLDWSGSIARYTMNARKDDWNSAYKIPRDPCDEYGQCGPYGICRFYKPIRCECLKGFLPRVAVLVGMVFWRLKR